MAGSSKSSIFDVDRIRQLVELMGEHELTEIYLEEGEAKIELHREKETIVAPAPVAAPMPYPMAPPVAPAPAPAPAAPAAAPAPAAPSEPAADAANIAVIESPMVGTFYSASDPESPPYVSVGTSVGPDTTVCLVEAMKVFNEIQAEVSGKVVAVLVKNGEPVEFGQPLFKVDTAG